MSASHGKFILRIFKLLVAFLVLIFISAVILFGIKYSSLQGKADETFLHDITKEFPSLSISPKLKTKTERIFSLTLEKRNTTGSGALSFGPYFLQCPTCILKNQIPFELINTTISNPIQKLYFAFPKVYGGLQADKSSVEAQFKTPLSFIRTNIGDFALKKTSGEIHIQHNGKSKDISLSLNSPSADLTLRCPNKKTSIALKLDDLTLLGAGSLPSETKNIKEIETQLLIQRFQFSVPASGLPLPLNPDKKDKPLLITLGGHITTPNKPGEMSITLSNWKNVLRRIDRAEKSKFLDLTHKQEKLGYLDLTQFPSTMTLAVHLDGNRITGKFGEKGQNLANILCFDLNALLQKFKNQ